MLPRLARSVVLLSLSVVSLASTCATAPITKKVDAEDRDRFTPSARMSYEILPGNDTRRRGSLLDLATRKAPFLGARADGSKVKKADFTLRIAGEYAMVDGQDDVDLPAGRNFQLGVTIPGPATVDTKIENYRGHLSVRPGGRFLDIVSVEGIIGIGVDSTEVRLRTPGFDTRDENTEPAFVVGGRLSLRPIPLFDLYGQVVFMSGNFSSADAEAGVQLNLTPNLGVYAGYRHWAYDKDSFRGSGSDVDLKLTGATAGGSLTF